MKKSGKYNFIKLAAFLKRNALSLLAVVLALVTMATGTSAWLERSGIMAVKKASGFQVRHELKVLRREYAVQTYYKDNVGVWHLITEDYLREEDPAAGWTVKWDEHCPVLFPGKRTEFRTVITNLTKHEKHAMVHLTDVDVETEIRERITIAAIEPEVVIYSGADETLFGEAEDTEGTWAEAKLLCLAPKIVIPPGETRTVEWYVLADGDTGCGGFPVLTDGEGNPITAPDGGYYAVNKTDEEGHVTEAFQCDELGVLVLRQGELIPYPNPEDYSSFKCDFLLTGFSPRQVRISGMIIAVGDAV